MSERQDYISFIVKLTDKCNLSCSYCYERAKLKESGAHRCELSSDQVKAMLKNIKHGLYDDLGIKNLFVNFIWHGGEPFLKKPSYFEDILKYTKRVFRNTSYVISHGIMSNGTISIKPFMPTLLKYDITPGFSIDYRSRLRQDKKGRNYKKKVRENISFLQSNGRKPAIICVISKQNVNYPVEMYNFFKRLDASFCVLQMRSYHPRTKHLECSSKEFGRFLIKLAKYWLNDFEEPQIGIGTVQQFISNLQGDYRSGGYACWQQENCAFRHLLIRADGSVGPCDNEPPTSSYNFGNILNQPLREIINHPDRLKLFKRRDVIKKMKADCKWLKYCWGGCPMDTPNSDYFLCTNSCESIKMIYEYLDSVRPALDKKCRALGRT